MFSTSLHGTADVNAGRIVRRGDLPGLVGGAAQVIVALT